MTREGRMTGKGFVGRVSTINGVLSLPALVIVLGCAAALLDMTAQMWIGLATATVVYGIVATPVSYGLNRRAMAPIADWLDSGDPPAELCERAFVAMLALPQRMAVSAALSWLLPSAAVSLGMKLVFPGLWNAWDTLVLVVGGLCAGFGVGVLMGFLVKSGRFAAVCRAIAATAGTPEDRARLAPFVPMRTKLLLTVTGTALVPLVFATLITYAEGSASLERLALGWTERVVRDLPQDGDEAAIAAARALLESGGTPIPIRLLPLSEARSLLPEHAIARLNEVVQAGTVEGDSVAQRAGAVFHWRRLADGSIWMAVVKNQDLYAHGATSWMEIIVLLAASVLFALSVAYFLARDISSPVALLREAAERLAAGDLRPLQLFESEDELGDLSRSFSAMVASLRTTIGRLAESADGLESRASRLGPVCRSLTDATSDQERGTRLASESMEQIHAQVAGIAQSSQALNESVEESSSSVLELGATGEELNETATLLSGKVDEVSSSIEQMVRSVKQVSDNTEALSGAAEETSASMEEMASSLREVDVSAAEAARLSETVVQRAQSGRAKVRETIVGMEAIREATETAEQVIRSLAGRTLEIGRIVDVIDDVADETNLLALNAAIIAAQAGDHGRAFSVVADEIKDLAERVLASTKEIGGLIRSVQDESRKATDAIERGSASVASGVDLSAEAGTALEEITAASQQSGTRIDGIVGALREQAKAAGHVVELMERVRGGVDEIRQAVAEQNRGNVVVFQGAVTMREVALQVRGTTEEQARGSVRIRESVEGVREAVEKINAALQEQSQACAAAAAFLEEVQGRSGTHDEATRTVEEVSRDLLAQAEDLREEVRRFRMV